MSRRWMLAAGVLALGVLVAAAALTAGRGSRAGVGVTAADATSPATDGSAAGEEQAVDDEAAEAPPEEQEERVLGEGSNRTPSGALGLLTYRVAEVRLARPVDATVEGRRVRTDRAYRLKVTGGPFPVRDMPVTILVNGIPLGVGQEAADLSAVSVRVMDRSLLAEGATVAVMYGASDGSYSELPERLHLEQ